MSDLFPRTPIHTFGESLKPQPLDYAGQLPARPTRPLWRKLVLIGLATVAISIAPLLFAALLFLLFHQVHP